MEDNSIVNFVELKDFLSSNSSPNECSLCGKVIKTIDHEEIRVVSWISRDDFYHRKCFEIEKKKGNNQCLFGEGDVMFN